MATPAAQHAAKLPICREDLQPAAAGVGDEHVTVGQPQHVARHREVGGGDTIATKGAAEQRRVGINVRLGADGGRFGERRDRRPVHAHDERLVGRLGNEEVGWPFTSDTADPVDGEDDVADCEVRCGSVEWVARGNDGRAGALLERDRRARARCERDERRHSRRPSVHVEFGLRQRA